MQASEGIFILYFAVTQNELFRASLTTVIMLAICASIIASMSLNIIQRSLDDCYRRMGFLIALCCKPARYEPHFLLSSHVGPYFSVKQGYFFVLFFFSTSVHALQTVDLLLDVFAIA